MTAQAGIDGKAGSRLRDAGEASLTLQNGARIAVLGGGPAGSFFAYFVLKMSAAMGRQVIVDLYEPRMFLHRGPAGCNHCGGVVSESLVQLLAAEGIDLPPAVVQRGIESYVLHTDVGSVRIGTPLDEKRIAAVYRGNGPRQSETLDIVGFDGFLLERARALGANWVQKVVAGVDMAGDLPRVRTVDGTIADYDLVAVATGVNSQLVQRMGESLPAFEPPQTLRAFICEFDLGREVLKECLGDAMHVFLLDLEHLEFAALIPKGDFATLCLLGDDVDQKLIDAFLATPEVRARFPGGVVPTPVCHCFPRINVQAAARPFADRVVWVGDSGVNRLFKDGIGSAYRTAKAAARTAVLYGVRAEDFQRGFWPECRSLIRDNRIAVLIFGVTTLIQKLRFVRRGVVRMTAREQRMDASRRVMSSVLWDVFTGSAPYREILLRTLGPRFPASLGWNVLAANLAALRAARKAARRHT